MGRITIDRIERYDMIPDYLEDLNAMRRVLKLIARITSIYAWGTYLINLSRIVNRDFKWGEFPNHAEFATAKQQAEAFLITAGKWKEDEPCAS